MLKRYLQENEASPIDDLSFNDVIRRGYDLGLLNAELSTWKEFRKNRGTTSHTYDTDKAQLIFEAIPAFLFEAKYLATQIADKQSFPK